MAGYLDLFPRQRTPYTDNFQTEERLMTNLLSGNQPPATATDEVNMATLNGARRDKSQYLSRTQNELIGGILNAKNSWDYAQNVINNPLSTDDQRQQALATQQQANDNANYLRDLAQRLNVNLTGYDSDTPLRDANLNYDAAKIKTIHDFIDNDMDSDQFYMQKYRDLIAKGYSPRLANKFAGSQAMEYRSQRLAKYATMMDMFGQNNGAMTREGALMLSMLGREADDPSVAGLGNVFGSLYASPQKQYDNAYQSAENAAARADAYNSAMNQLGLRHENALDELLQKYLYNVATNEQLQGYKQDNIKLTGQENRKTTEFSQNNQAKIDAERDARKWAHEKEMEIQKAQIKELTRAGEIEKALKIHEGKKEIDQKYGVTSSTKEKDTVGEALKQLKELQPHFDEWKAQHPEADDEGNPWYDQIDHYRDQAMGRFEGDPNNYNVAWSWITDFMEKCAVDRKNKAKREQVKKFAYGNFPKWIADDIIQILENNNYNGFTSD